MTTFSVLRTIDGYEVVADDTGRPVLSRDTQNEAQGAAQRLNTISKRGDRASLAHALSTSGSSTKQRSNPSGTSEPIDALTHDGRADPSNTNAFGQRLDAIAAGDLNGFAGSWWD